MFDIPESDIVGVRVDEEAVKASKCPEYIRSRPTTSTDADLEQSVDANEMKTKENHDSKLSIPTG